MEIAYLIVWISMALVCYAIAKDKEKNVYIAIAWGLCFGIFAVIGYALSKGSLKYQRRKAQENIDKLK